MQNTSQKDFPVSAFVYLELNPQCCLNISLLFELLILEKQVTSVSQYYIFLLNYTIFVDYKIKEIEKTSVVNPTKFKQTIQAWIDMRVSNIYTLSMVCMRQHFKICGQ